MVFQKVHALQNFSQISSVSHSRFFRQLGASISSAKLRKFQTHRKTTCLAICPKFSNLPLAIPAVAQNTHKYLVSLRKGVPMCLTGGGTGNVLVVMSSIEGKGLRFANQVS